MCAVGTRSRAIRRCTSRRHFRFCPANPCTVRGMFAFFYLYWTCEPGSRGSASLRAPESAHQQWGGSPHRTEHWLSVVEGNCVVERRGGRQPEMNCQSINKAMLNTIRPDALASLRRVSEAQNRTPTRKGQGNFGDLFQRRDSERGRRNAWGGW